jgi:hypothetical protein
MSKLGDSCVREAKRRALFIRRSLMLLFVVLPFPFTNALASTIIFSQNFESHVLSAIEQSQNWQFVQPGFNGSTTFGNASGYSNLTTYSYSVQIDLTHVTNASLTFDLSGVTETCCDIFRVSEGNTMLGGYSGNLPGGSHTFSLTSGAPELLTLSFQTDGSVTFSGVQFDNVVVVGDVAPVPIPPSGLLLASGLLPLVGRWWRRRATSAEHGC